MRDPSLWKTDAENRPSPGMILCSNGPSVPGYNPLTESQTNTVPGRGAILAAVRPLKQAGQILFFKAAAAVMDGDLDDFIFAYLKTQIH